MKNAENVRSCLQRDSTECEGYAGAQSAVQPGNEETAGRSQKLLEAILYRDNLNRAYKRVKANKGAPGVDGMTVEEALSWLKERDSEAGWRSTQAGDSHGQRPDCATGNRSTAHATV